MAAWTCRVLLYRGARVLAGRTGAVAADSCLFQSVRTVKTTTWWEEHLTEDNKSYMRKSLGEEYNRQIAAKLHPLKDEPWPRQEWTEESRRVGLVAVKLGMAPVWTKTGERHVVTMLQVTHIRTHDTTHTCSQSLTHMQKHTVKQKSQVVVCVEGAGLPCVEVPV
ncbi:unnamed protein product [Coregonus sp. 'balchen']|nr:unnamed protein product [Coregonus sp. 'balchen']